MTVPLQIWFSRCLAVLAGAGALCIAGESGARAGELVVIVDTGTEMPMANVVRGAVTDGLHKDLAVELARAMGRSPVITALPRKRLASALESGKADLLCVFMPAWLPGPFDWSRPFFPISEVIVSSRSAPRPVALSALSGQRIGTVLGYVYPELDAAMGKDFVREDAPSADLNWRKLAAGRINHAATVATFIDYRRKLNDMSVALHEPLLIKSYRSQCAVSRSGSVTLPEVDAAIAQLIKDGTLTRIIQRYR